MEAAVVGSRKPLQPEAADPPGRLSTSSGPVRPLGETGRFSCVLAPALASLAVPFPLTDHVNRDKAVSGNPGLCLSPQGQRRAGWCPTAF